MKFNLTTKGKNRIVNYESEQIYKLLPERQLYTAAYSNNAINPFASAALNFY